MAGVSRSQCNCGLVFDPTIEFQKSSCCGARLIRRTCHYVCAKCRKAVPSRFLFDERIFSTEYFRQKMAESRESRQRKKEEIRRFLADSRSGALCLTDVPDLGSVPGLESALNAFVGSVPEMALANFWGADEFKLEDYRRHILDALPCGCLIRFEAIPALCKDRRLDRVRRFVTLIFMWQAMEVSLIQTDSAIVVERYNEVYGEGL